MICIYTNALAYNSTCHRTCSKQSMLSNRSVQNLDIRSNVLCPTDLSYQEQFILYVRAFALTPSRLQGVQT